MKINKLHTETKTFYICGNPNHHHSKPDEATACIHSDTVTRTQIHSAAKTTNNAYNACQLIADGNSIDQVAEIMERRPSTIKRWVARIIPKMFNEFGKEYGIEYFPDGGLATASEKSLRFDPKRWKALIDDVRSYVIIRHVRSHRSIYEI